MLISDVRRNQIMQAAIQACTDNGYRVIEVWASDGLKIILTISTADGPQKAWWLIAPREDAGVEMHHAVTQWLISLSKDTPDN